MVGHVFTQRRIEPIPRPELTAAGKVTLALLTLLGLGALAGGIALVVEPDGSIMHFDPALLAGSPFSDYLVPGLILGACSASAHSSWPCWGSATSAWHRSSPSPSAVVR